MNYTANELLAMAENFESLAEDGLLKEAKKDVHSDFIFPADHPKVNDHKSHFPIPDAAHGRNAIARSNQYSKVPDWYKGSLQSLINSVVRAVHKKFPGIEISEAAKKPGKG